jgi:hypothetical protein
LDPSSAWQRDAISASRSKSFASGHLKIGGDVLPLRQPDLAFAPNDSRDDAGIHVKHARKTEHSGDPDQPFQAIPITHSDRSDQYGAVC